MKKKTKCYLTYLVKLYDIVFNNLVYVKQKINLITVHVNNFYIISLFAIIIKGQLYVFYQGQAS